MPIQAAEAAWNESMMADFRSHGGQITQGPLTGASLLLMTSTGAKSGQARTTPLGYTRDGERYVVIGSNSGRDDQPAWLTNVKANPIVTLEVGSERFQARATVTEGAERRRLLDAHIAAIPAFGDYERMTSREIPAVVLERIAERAR